MLFGQLFELCGEERAGIVDQNVEASEFGFDGGEQFLNIAAVRYVGLNGNGAAA